MGDLMGKARSSGPRVRKAQIPGPKACPDVAELDSIWPTILESIFRATSISQVSAKSGMHF